MKRGILASVKAARNRPAACCSPGDATAATRIGAPLRSTWAHKVPTNSGNTALRSCAVATGVTEVLPRRDSLITNGSMGRWASEIAATRAHAKSAAVADGMKLTTMKLPATRSAASRKITAAWTGIRLRPINMPRTRNCTADTTTSAAMATTSPASRPSAIDSGTRLTTTVMSPTKAIPALTRLAALKAPRGSAAVWRSRPSSCSTGKNAPKATTSDKDQNAPKWLYWASDSWRPTIAR